MIIDNNKHSFISSAGCHHTDSISCKMTETWRLQSVVSPQPVARMRPSKLFIAVHVQYDSLTLFLQSQIRCNGLKYLFTMCMYSALVDYHVSNDTSVQNLFLVF